MSLFIKSAILCIICALFSVSIRRTSPEISLLMAVGSLLCCASVIIHLFEELKGQITGLLNNCNISFEFFLPLLKCCAVSVISQISSSLCKDAGQAAAAVGLEYTGNLVSILCLLPLIDALFNLIGGLL